MEITFSMLHLSEFAVPTASPALPSAPAIRLAQAPAAASPLVATICPQPHQVQAWTPALESIMTPVAGGTPSDYSKSVSKRINELDGFRGIPPRGRPKV